MAYTNSKAKMRMENKGINAATSSHNLLSQTEGG